MNHLPASFPMDGSSLYFMAQAAPDHTNVYRMSVSLKEAACPQTLQKAVDRIYARFPTIVAGFRPGPFDYSLIPAVQPPQVQPDLGLLTTMPMEELGSCAYRVYYRQNQIILEVFHALTDGYGALASLRALLGEYLHLRYGTATPERETYLLTQPDWESEWEDSYLHYGSGPTASLPRRNSYRIPGGTTQDPITAASRLISTQQLRKTAKKAGVSVTALLSTLMAESIMEVQKNQGVLRDPVRIMVAADLRRLLPSKTFRNFVLYALPTLEPADIHLPFHQRLQAFQKQLRQQLDRDFLAGQVARNQKLQNNPLFRFLPVSWKFAFMRLSNRIFGESNSSITLTNLGPLDLSEAMMAHVESVGVFLTPRRRSPYNCGLISCGDTTTITITQFGTNQALETLFFGKLQTFLNF